MLHFGLCSEQKYNAVAVATLSRGKIPDNELAPFPELNFSQFINDRRCESIKNCYNGIMLRQKMDDV